MISISKFAVKPPGKVAVVVGDTFKKVTAVLILKDRVCVIKALERSTYY